MIDINKLPNEETSSSHGSGLSKETENENGSFAQSRAKSDLGDGYLSRSISEHNHELSPKRRVESDEEVETQVNQLLASNKNASRNSRVGEGDAESIFDYFVCFRKQDPDFFYVPNVNENRSLRNIFWADGRSRALYKSFGDVISFESIYLNKNFKLPLVSFIGVNHHGQSILLGCGLLYHVDKEGYLSLFTSLLKCMSGQVPEALITDEGTSIQEAVSEAFPEVRHRLCVNDIVKKISSKLSGLPDYVTIEKELKSIVFDSPTPPEFEENWEHFIRKCNLENNDWLTTLYSDRARWAPVFIKKTFWAGLSGIAQNENENENAKPFFDGCVQPETTLKQFMERYDAFIRSKIEKEEHADFTSWNSVIPLITYFPFEKQFQEAYTNEIFKLFQEELKGLIYCKRALVDHKDKTKGPIHICQVTDSLKQNDGSRRSFTYSVRFNSRLGRTRTTCGCRLFEFHGILCRHIAAVFFDRDVKEVPSRYILSRWRKDVTYKHNGVTETPQFGEIRSICRRVAEIGAESGESFDFAMKLLDETKETMIKRKAENSGSTMKKQK